MNEIKVGDVFRNWTVIEILPWNGKIKEYVIQCSCENKTVRKMESWLLRNNKSEWCAKCKPKKEIHGIEIGKIYDNWKVLSKNEELTKEKKESIFTCECQCEFKTIQDLPGWQLKSDKHKSCLKCVVKNRRHDIKSGDKFGHWTVIKEDGKQYTNIMYLCECDCNNKTQKRQRAYYLVNGGNDISCQKCCVAGKSNIKNRTGTNLISGQYIAGLRLDAEERGLEFKINKEYIHDLFVQQRNYCKLTGTYLVFSDYDRYEQTASLDRINNNEGYKEGNLRWVHKHTNKIRGKLANEKLLYYCELIVKNIYRKLPPLKYELKKRGNQWQGYMDLSKSSWTEVEKRARNFNRELNLDIKDGWELAEKQGFRCALTGLPLTFGYKGECNASLDRIDSTKGYTKDNVQWVHKDINWMKWELDQNYFIYLCRSVYEHSKLDGNIFSFI